jgi:hypothetical protein
MTVLAVQALIVTLLREAHQLHHSSWVQPCKSD